MTTSHEHTEQIEAGKLPVYLAAAQKVGNVAVTQIASQGEKFFGYSKYNHGSIDHMVRDYEPQYVMDNHAVVLISGAEGTGDFYREVENLVAQDNSK